MGHHCLIIFCVVFAFVAEDIFASNYQHNSPVHTSHEVYGVPGKYKKIHEQGPGYRSEKTYKRRAHHKKSTHKTKKKTEFQYRKEGGHFQPEVQIIEEKPIKRCGLNQRWTECGTACPLTCKNYLNPPTGCTKNCVIGCECIEGFLKDTDGSCVRKEQCSVEPSCPHNTTFSRFVTNCRTCDNPNCKKCPDIPQYGCYCNPGFVLNRRNNECVRPQYCPGFIQCGQNQYLHECASPIDPTCGHPNPPSCYLKECHKRCVCKPSYIRKSQGGPCIPRSECPVYDRCGPYATYNHCASLCERTCQNRHYAIKCLAGCQARCECNEGYIKDLESGKCVRNDHCPPVKHNITECGANEYYDKCGSSCPVTCDNCARKIRHCSTKCVSGCFCKHGYARDTTTNRCVQLSQCPTRPVCGDNEEYRESGTDCHTCDNYRVEKCPTKHAPGCYCIHGYVRDALGKCIPTSKCPRCPPGKVWNDCGSSCPDTCNNWCIKHRPCTKDCRQGCFCRKGLVLNTDTNKCIPKKRCPHPPTCGHHEVFKWSGYEYTCDNYRTKQAEEINKPGCYCASGYARNSSGVCIPTEECPRTCGENQEYVKCCTSCPVTCQNFLDHEPCPFDCKPGCACRHGYVLEKIGSNRCVRKEHCPVFPKCVHNAEYRPSGGLECTCSDQHKERCEFKREPGCYCIKGYVKASCGTCVPNTVCPKHCPPHEEYVNCKSQCPVTCNNWANRHQNCSLPCKPGCQCVYNYVRDEQSGRCVKKSDCPVKPECGPHEIYLEEGYNCQTCDNFGNAVCALIKEPGCYCQKNCVRDKYERCTPIRMCPNYCPENEERSSCVSQCQPTCKNWFLNNRHCALPCKPGCKCVQGHVRDVYTGVCIPIKECPRPSCGTNEEYKEFGSDCATCDNWKKAKCLPKPEPGCYCLKGYVRNSHGVCIHCSECPAKCGPNEIWQKYGTNCRTCEKRSIDCYKFEPGCYCDRGFVRHKGRCIHPRQCPQVQCGPNEVFKTSGEDCLTCKNLHSVECPTIHIAKCYCIDGYVRDRQGKCINKHLCPNFCGRHEVYDECASACPDTCDNYFVPHRRCTKQCVQKCRCKGGYVIDTRTGKCVLKTNCPPRECGKNEEYKTSGRDCLTCDNFRESLTCVVKMEPGCYCKHGLVRDKDGRCIHKHQCRNYCGPHEKYDECAPACPDTCKNWYIKNKSCPYPCRAGCRCKRGYVRDDQKMCTLRKNCPVVRCGINEEFRMSGYDCLTCNNFQSGITCDLKEEPGCYCMHGFVRNNNGRCVEKRDCPNYCRPNEEYSNCASACPVTCEDWYKQNKVCTLECKPACQCKKGYVLDLRTRTCILREQCPPIICGDVNEEFKFAGYDCLTCDNFRTASCAMKNIPGCYCKAGLVRNSQGKCVQKYKCPNYCRRHEDYNPCANQCPATCDNWYKRNRVCNLACIPGCECKKGYVIDRRINACILRESCPPVKCGINEEFKMAGYDCLNCNNFRSATCVLVNHPGCYCKQGFVRNSAGVCSHKYECASYCGHNEKYSPCASQCPVNCLNWYKKDKSCTLACKPGCQCRPGFVRDLVSNACIRRESCPPIRCPPGEEFRFAGSDCLTCSNFKTAVCPIKNEPGCYCKDGYVRGRNGRCRPKQECRTYCKDHEEYHDCVSQCPDTCENWIYTNRRCELPCKAGCRCEQGYVLDTVRRVCVKKETCPPIKCRGKNEVFKWAGFDGRTCDNFRMIVAIIVNKPACYCKDNYVRNSRGECVPKYECPNYCKQNEKYSTCASQCPSTCANFIFPERLCPLPCKPGCHCDKGFVYDTAVKLCVRREKCLSLPKCPNPNEEFKWSGFNCATCDNFRVVKCALVNSPGCYCKDGHVRDRNGKCVPTHECSSYCPANEEYNLCSTACPATCENWIHKNRPCKKICKPACQCKPGFVRDVKNNHCVLKERCPYPPICYGKNEVFRWAWHKCTRCDNFKLKCPIQNIPGCYCRDGYVRNANGVCILKNQCPNYCSENEEYVKCVNTCPDTCENFIYQNRPCTKECRPGCQCKPGHVRDVTRNKCVLLRNCPTHPTCYKLNEVFKWSGFDCATCANLGHVKCELQAIPGCYCREGYVRNENRDCVKVKRCPNYCRANEEFDKCATQCPKTCTNWIYNNHCPLPCKPGCKCKKGFVHCMQKNRCVLKEKCSQLPKCLGKNEIFQWSGHNCGNCENLGLEKCPLVNVPGCYCIDGHVKGPNGCIPVEECRKWCPINEEFNECSTACPDTCENWVKPRSCSLKCRVGCRCKHGYVRNEISNKCVLKKDCPHPPKCGPGEIFKWFGSDCSNCHNYLIAKCPTEQRPGCYCIDGYTRYNGICIPFHKCPNYCPEHEEHVLNSSQCPETCENWIQKNRRCALPHKPGCQCKPGFIRDVVNNRCVRREKCPHPPICLAKNEIFQWSGYDCLTCDNFQTAICPLITGPGCYCHKNYVRLTRGGPCVPKKLCPKYCRVNEEYDTCASQCPETCDNWVQKRGVCKLSCRSACRCKVGYVRDVRNNKCVLKKQCPTPPVCLHAHEVFKWYGSDCVTCYNTHGRDCKEKLLPGCYCMDGYVRHKGHCIARHECPNYCRENEVFEECVTQCPETCSNWIQKNRPCTLKCLPGCRCKLGYVLDPKENVCIKKEDCNPPPSCPPNEIFKWVGTDCANCENFGNAKCELIRVPGCYCQDGFVRYRGRCIRKRDCPNYCRENEEHNSCVTPCPDTCDNWIHKNRPCSANCRPGCRCKHGYVRDLVINACVLKEKCSTPVKCYGENEIFAWSGYDCATCENLGKVKCTLRTNHPACYCREGYVRNSEGKCVVVESCPKWCPTNEHYEVCAKPCPDTCENWIHRNRTCHNHCKPDCVCDKGLVRDTKTNRCIPKEHCTVPCECYDKNEVFRWSGYDCLTCDNYRQRKCVLLNRAGCYCREGYVRLHKGGRCVPVRKCPKWCPDNEDFSECTSACPETCENWAKPRPCPAKCVRGCKCKKGYVREVGTNVCVKKVSCPKPPNCDEGEVFKWYGSDCRTCDNFKSAHCLPIKLPGCYCMDGYCRYKGKCIPCVKCPNYCPAKEEFHTCATQCPDTCDNWIHKQRPCKLPCKPGCLCKKGLVRNPRNNKCVEPKRCPRPPICFDVNEVFQWQGSQCPTCDNFHQTVFPVVNEPGCFCKPGFVRDGKRCIRVEECLKWCPRNEKYHECAPPCPATCDNWVHKERPCRAMCRPGCTCKDGYVRDSRTKKCVKVELCPYPPTCGVNEVFKWYGSDCLSCKNFRTIQCPSTKVPGCYCRDGHLRHNGKCIPFHECPEYCGPNEEYKPCVSACPKTCENWFIRNRPCNLPCTPGCQCKKEYVRNRDGQCILRNNCPTPRCPHMNEVFKLQGFDCATCDNYKVVKCALIKEPACYCKSGMVRNSKGICVLPADCPIKCGPNEIYQHCGPANPETCENWGDYSRPCLKKCVAGCFCKPGFIKGPGCNCIPKEACPLPPVCGKNEELRRSGYDCLTCLNYKSNIDCPLIHERRCYCRAGYVRDPLNRCVKPSECVGCERKVPNCRLVACQDCVKTCQGTVCAFKGCLTRCVCEEGYCLKSLTDRQCIPIGNCPRAIHP